MKAAIIVAAAAFATATAASADPQDAYQVYDSDANLVGQLLGPGVAAVSIGNTLYQLELQRQEASSYAFSFPNANFWYTNSTCTGQRYLFDYGEVPQRLYYEDAPSPGSQGHQLWSYNLNNNPQTLALQSYWYADGGYCVAESYIASYNVVQAAPVEGYKLYPPFCIGGRNGRPCSTR